MGGSVGLVSLFEWRDMKGDDGAGEVRRGKKADAQKY